MIILKLPKTGKQFVFSANVRLQCNVLSHIFFVLSTFSSLPHVPVPVLGILSDQLISRLYFRNGKTVYNIDASIPGLTIVAVVAVGLTVVIILH